MKKIMSSIVLVSLALAPLFQPAFAGTTVTEKRVVNHVAKKTPVKMAKNVHTLKKASTHPNKVLLKKPSTYHYVDTPYENANTQKGKYNFDKPLDTYYSQHPGVDASNNPYTHYSLPSGIY